jgi:thioredoxin-like negative regulator of GroEL
MMLCSFMILCGSFVAHRDVETLTDSNFERIVARRPPGSIFLVMFHGEHCPACQSAYPSFTRAASALKGIARFGLIDCGRQAGLAGTFKIWSIPQFRLFDAQGVSSIATFFRSESSLIGNVIDRLPVSPEVVNESWLNSEQIPNAVILVTKRWKMPWQWKAIAFNFSGTALNVGIANSRKSRRLFNTADDTVQFVRDGKMTEYKGRLSFLELQSAISEYFAKALKSARRQSHTRSEL